jgi:membrane-associated protease RseP (regulator of RpoE activity)
MSIISSILSFKYAIIFYLGIIIFLYIFRKKFDRQGKFIFLYRTKYGIKFFEKVAKKFPKTVKWLSNFGIWISYPLILIITGLIIKSFLESFILPRMIRVAPVLPGLPIAGTSLVFPLVTGWLCLFIIILIHESSHGIVARFYKLKVVSSGIAFFGPLLAAFVEPDEKELDKSKPRIKNAVYAAGPFSNILTGILFFLISLLLISPFVNFTNEIDSMTVTPINNSPIYNLGITEQFDLVKINDIDIVNTKEFFLLVDSTKPNDTLKLTTKNNEFYVNATSNPDNSSKGFIGITYNKFNQVPKFPGFLGLIAQKIANWLDSFFFWLFFIGINIGLINLFPIYITDGAKLVESALLKHMKDKKKAMKVWSIINKTCLWLLILLFFAPLIRLILNF